MTKVLILRSVLFGLMFAFLTINSAFAQTTEFTYQGKLTDTGTQSAAYDFEFRLCASASDCATPLATQQKSGVAVSGGVFTVTLDFGAGVFDGSNRFLEIAVKRPAEGTFTTLSPRQPLTSAPYAIRSLGAAQADVALDSQKLGGVDASQYVTTSSVGNSFIKNSATQQTADFNISGTGIIGGTLGVGMNPGGFKFSVNGPAQIRPRGTDESSIGFFSNVTANIPTVALSTSDGSKAEMRLQAGALKLATGFGFGTPNDGITIARFGNVGIGTDTPTVKFEVNGNTLLTPGGSGGQIQLGVPSGETGMTIFGTNRADIRFDGTTLKLLAGTGAGAMASTNGININTLGNVGIGTTTPTAKLQVEGGGGGIFSTGFRAVNNSALGSAISAVNNSGGNALTATGDVSVTGNVRQDLSSNGLPKAMALIRVVRTGFPATATATVLRCYNSVNNTSSGNCGFSFGTVFTTAGVEVNFGFTVNNRFISLTGNSQNTPSVVNYPNPTTVSVLDGTGTTEFFIFVF